jgi:siroheme decarboxylase
MKEFTELEKRILNRIQKDWSITQSPYSEIAQDLNINEDILMQHIDNLKKEKIVREISAIFNAASLGYESALIAFEVPESDIDNAALNINAHTGVSHNYLRDNKYNIWFTLTIRGGSFEEEVGVLAEKSRAKDFLILKNEKLFKIGLMLNIGEDNPAIVSNSGRSNKIRSLSGTEKKAVLVLQSDLPLDRRPFIKLIESLNIDIDEKSIVQTAEALKKDGIMRRFGAVLKHTNAGYGFNAMTVWDIEDKSDTDIENIFLPVQNISHLYKRTIFPGKWEYGLFAMIHARSEKELKNLIDKLEHDSGIRNYSVLNSIREFKKKRVKYFTEEFERKL